MNRLFFLTIVALLVASACGHACFNQLLVCIEDPRVTKVVNNPQSATKAQGCAAAEFLLKCIKKCPPAVIDAAGLRSEVNDLENAHNGC